MLLAVHAYTTWLAKSRRRAVCEFFTLLCAVSGDDSPAPSSGPGLSLETLLPSRLDDLDGKLPNLQSAAAHKTRAVFSPQPAARSPQID